MVAEAITGKSRPLMLLRTPCGDPAMSRTCAFSLGWSLVTRLCLRKSKSPALLWPHPRGQASTWSLPGPAVPPALSPWPAARFPGGPAPSLLPGPEPCSSQAAPQGGPCLEAPPSDICMCRALAQTWGSRPPAGAFSSPTLSS